MRWVSRAELWSTFASRRWFCIFLLVGFYSAGATEAEFPALTSRTSDYEFRDGTKVSVKAIGHVYKDSRIEILKLDNLEVRLNEKIISPKRFKNIGKEVLGVRLETIQILREDYSNTPDEVLWRYFLVFKYNSFVYDSASSVWVKETWKEIGIGFDEKGIQNVRRDGRSIIDP